MASNNNNNNNLLIHTHTNTIIMNRLNTHTRTRNSRAHTHTRGSHTLQKLFNFALHLASSFWKISTKHTAWSFARRCCAAAALLLLLVLLLCSADRRALAWCCSRHNESVRMHTRHWRGLTRAPTSQPSHNRATNRERAHTRERHNMRECSHCCRSSMLAFVCALALSRVCVILSEFSYKLCVW